MTPANPDALADALAQHYREEHAYLRSTADEMARALVAGPLAPLLADLQRVTAERDAEYHRANKAIIREATTEARAAQLQAEVEAKDRRIAALEEALAPFADEAERYDPPTGDDDVGLWDVRGSALCLRNLRAARAATAREGQADE